MNHCIKRVVFFGVLFFFSITLYAQKLFHDTLFFERNITWTYSNNSDSHDSDQVNYSGMFVETNKESKNYTYVLDYDFKNIIPSGYYNPDGKIDKEALKEIPDKWYPVTIYKDKFYITLTNSFNKDLLTDTAFIRSGMEGVYSNGINSFEKINSNTFQLTANTGDNQTFTIRIHFIDTHKELAVFEKLGKDERKNSYSLMVGGNKIKSFPLIVRFSKTRVLPDTIWYLNNPGNFYTPPINGKWFLNERNAKKILQQVP